MHFRHYLAILSGFVALTAVATAAHHVPKPSPNGIKFPVGYQDWTVISMSHRVDNKTVRVIYGNDQAIKAIKAGKTNPWPNGSIIGKVVWKEKVAEDWAGAIVPGKFVHAEFMFKDAKKYAKTGGWGWARWTGLDQKPHGKDASLADACVACHTPVKNKDWVFTEPAMLPGRHK
ncbi:MAG: cytochrome P460 family protein [Gammaproteobacteria bacterium]|nr:cytochrome P460 family protein [Gammaproteobacteria bacterium]